MSVTWQPAVLLASPLRTGTKLLKNSKRNNKIQVKKRGTKRERTFHGRLAKTSEIRSAYLSDLELCQASPVIVAVVVVQGEPASAHVIQDEVVGVERGWGRLGDICGVDD